MPRASDFLPMHGVYMTPEQQAGFGGNMLLYLGKGLYAAVINDLYLLPNWFKAFPGGAEAALAAKFNPGVIKPFLKMERQRQKKREKEMRAAAAKPSAAGAATKPSDVDPGVEFWGGP
jgi:hypothetical protein